MQLPNSYWSVILNLPNNSFIGEMQSNLDNGSLSINEQSFKIGLAQAKKQLQQIISTQEGIYNKVKEYYINHLKSKASNQESFEDFLKNYSHLGAINKIANISNQKNDDNSIEIIPDNLYAQFDKFQKENWEDVDTALSLFFNRQYKDKDKLKDHINKTLLKFEKDKQKRINNLLEFLNNLDKATKESLEKQWHGQEQTIFNGKDYDIITKNYTAISESLSRARTAASKKAIFAQKELQLARKNITDILLSDDSAQWRKDMEFDSLPKDAQKQLLKRMQDYAILQFVMQTGLSDSYGSIDMAQLEQPIKIIKGKQRKSARANVQELKPQFNLGKMFDKETLKNNIIAIHSGGERQRTITTYVTAKWPYEDTEYAQELLSEMYQQYKTDVSATSETFDDFKKGLFKLQERIQEVQDKIDDYILLGDKEKNNFPYAIAFSDKLYHPFEDNSHLANIGLDNGTLSTNLNSFLNGPLGRAINENMAFSLLNTSKASAYSNYMLDLSSYISQILNAYILDLTMDPLNFVQQLQQQYGFSGEVLYMYKFGGFNIPVFEALQQIYNKMEAFELQKQLIKTLIIADTSNPIQIYTSALVNNPEDQTARWNYVANYIASNTGVKVIADLHQITQMFLA